jgi:chromosome segregation ATPase
MTGRDKYIAAMKTQLDELNAQMGKVEAKAEQAKDGANAKYKEEMTKLRHESKQAAAKLDQLKVAGEDAWVAMVTEMDKLRDAFTHSFRYFKSQL